MKFDYSSANRVLFGVGISDQVGNLIEGWGSRAIIIHGTGSAPIQKILSHLQRAGVYCIPYIINHEPSIDIIIEGLEIARLADVSFVIAVGGGSAIDTGKAIAALLTNPGQLQDYLEIIGLGKALTRFPLPFMAIPTTAGTGSEVTKNAVIGVPEKNVKVSLRSLHLLPRIALVDPELTLGLPKSITAFTGMDALTQLLEAYVSMKANWLVDTICRDGLSKAGTALRKAYGNPNDLKAREMMSYASLLSGMALANAGLGAVHGFAGPIGGMFDAPHGAICARLLPSVVRMNISVLQRLKVSPEILEKYIEIARLVTGNQKACLDDGILWLEQLCEELEIPRLATHGVTHQHFGEIIEKSSVASSMKGNPVVLSRGDMLEILERSL